EQIRNTAMRFKLNTTVQRYNTYQQYWQRVCREIENGTYRRDLARAAERFGDAALTSLGKRRQKMFEKGMAKKAERDAVRARSSIPPAPEEESPTHASTAPPSGVAPSARPPSPSVAPPRVGPGSTPPPSVPRPAAVPLSGIVPGRGPAPAAAGARLPAPAA